MAYFCNQTLAKTSPDSPDECGVRIEKAGKCKEHDPKKGFEPLDHEGRTAAERKASAKAAESKDASKNAKKEES